MSENKPLKEVIRCSECANRLYDMGIGFMSETKIICSVMNCEVEADDGCTFGAKGAGSYIKKEYDVSIGEYFMENDCGDFEYVEFKKV